MALNKRPIEGRVSANQYARSLHDPWSEEFEPIQKRPHGEDGQKSKRVGAELGSFFFAVRMNLLPCCRSRLETTICRHHGQAVAGRHSKRKVIRVRPPRPGIDHSLRRRIDLSALRTHAFARDESRRFDCSTHTRQNGLALAALQPATRKLKRPLLSHGVHLPAAGTSWPLGLLSTSRRSVNNPALTLPRSCQRSSPTSYAPCFIATCGESGRVVWTKTKLGSFS